MKTLNKYSKIITQDETQSAAQAMLYAIGLTEEGFAKTTSGNCEYGLRRKSLQYASQRFGERI